MQTHQPQVYQFSAFEAGVDWLTATGKRGRQGRPFRDALDGLITQGRAAAGDVKAATLRDYSGYRGDGWFAGQRREDSIIVLSGPTAARHFEQFAPLASNVSRLDLQVTLWTHGEQPQYAREQYHYLRQLPAGRGRPRNLTLIQSHPKGETLNVGKRSSDTYGRVYDWAAAHTSSAPRTIWRLEVEYKRAHAARQAAAALAAPSVATHTSFEVHRWFSTRRLLVPFAPEDSRYSCEQSLVERNRDALAWFETSISKTIAREINRHGLERVLTALGLADKVRPVQRKGDSANAHTAGLVPANRHR